MSARAIDRWQGFLTQIHDRHKLVREEASVGARDALRESGYDVTPIGVAWMGVNDRLLELEKRIIDTWHEKVESAFEAEGYQRPALDAERRKGEDLAFALENARQSVEMHVYAEGAREIHTRSLATQRERNCPTCTAPFEVPVVYRALNLRCAHCGAVSTFEPGTLARTAIAFGAHAFSWVSAEREWYAMRDAERRVRDQRPPVALALLKAYEAAQIAFWSKYFATKGQLEPELHDVAREVRSRLEWWYTASAEHEEEWRAAGRPRAQI
jgi:hypothetical protein